MGAPLGAAVAAVGAAAEGVGIEGGFTAEAGANEMFGPPPSQGPESDPQAINVPDQPQKVNDNVQLKLDRAGLTALCHTPEIVNALLAIGNAVAADCNDRKHMQDAQYGVLLQMGEEWITPQVLVMPSNYVGVLDDAAESTMMVVAGNYADANIEFQVGEYVPETEDPDYPLIEQ